MSAPDVRLWYASDAVLRRIRPTRLRVAARSVVAGAWMGAGTDRWRVEVDEEAYARRYAYHDSDEHNLRGLFAWEAEAIAASFPTAGRVLVTSAGGGREVIALRRMGYDVVGTECHPVLRERARELLLRLATDVGVMPAERDRVGSVEGPFDAAVVGWGAYTFLRGTARRRAFLAELGALLTPGAPVLLSFFAREGDPRRFRWLAAVGNAVGGLLGRERVEVGDVLDPTWQHYVAREELDAELASAGLRLERWIPRPYAHAIARRPLDLSK
ncbi:MAG: class I SAM-dependent methyltransferase [Alphaproteobacteria bacterium]|nr:class I SAM-dependent methyltransferase [Alphaproteobacteria bacterium]